MRGAVRGVPEDWRRGAELARTFAPDLVLTDFDGFTYLYAKVHRLPVISVGNIQMVDRCQHDADILRGVRRDYLEARAFVGRKLPRADRYLITTFFHPPIRKQRTTLVPSILRPEILAARPESGDHLLVYGRIGETSTAALRASGVPCLVYGARDGLTADEEDGNLRYRPFSNERFIDDLRTCRGVVASAGFSLMSEVVYLRKPMLALPLAGQFEQEMNARYLERLGYGTAATALDEPALERFLDGESAHAEALAGYEQDGNAETLAAVDRAIDEVLRPVSELEIGRTLILFAWAFGLAGIEIEIEGGYGWAERLPTWFRKRGLGRARLRRGDGAAPADRLPRVRVHDPAARAAPAVRRRSRVDARRRAEDDRDVLRPRGRLGLSLVRAQPRLHGAQIRAWEGLVVRRSLDLALPARLLRRRGALGRASRASRPWRPATASRCGATCGCWPASPCSWPPPSSRRRSTTGGTGTCGGAAPTTAS